CGAVRASLTQGRPACGRDRQKGIGMKKLMAPVLAGMILWGGASLAAENTAPAPDPVLLEKAAKGDAKAQYDMGIAYASGNGAPRDHRAAVSWLEKAAAQKHVEAQYDLGMIYMFTEDDGLRQPEKSAQWFLRAAEQ